MSVRNDLLCVELDVNLYSLTLSVTKPIVVKRYILQQKCLNK